MIDLTVSTEELKELEAKYAGLVKGQSLGDNIVGEMGYRKELNEIRVELAIREEQKNNCPDVYEMRAEELQIRVIALRKLVKEMHLKEYHQDKKIESLENYCKSIEPDKQKSIEKLYDIRKKLINDELDKEELLDKLQDLAFNIGHI